MDYPSDQNELFERWKATEKHSGRHFIQDGIIDPEKWIAARIKVLFLLKEAYGSITDLTEFIRKDAVLNKRTWMRCACWAHAAQSEHPLAFEDIQSNDAVKRDALLSCAVVNIKKSDGRRESDMSDILSYAKQDSALLQEQINLIAPTLIISGGVFDCWEEIWRAKPEKKARRVWLVGNNIPAINFPHPANHNLDDFMYWSILKVLSDARPLIH